MLSIYYIIYQPSLIFSLVPFCIGFHVLYSVGNYVYISKPIRLAVNLYRANSDSDRRYLFKLLLCHSVFMGISF